MRFIRIHIKLYVKWTRQLKSLTGRGKNLQITFQTVWLEHSPRMPTDESFDGGAKANSNTTMDDQQGKSNSRSSAITEMSQPTKKRRFGDKDKTHGTMYCFRHFAAALRSIPPRSGASNALHEAFSPLPTYTFVDSNQWIWEEWRWQNHTAWLCLWSVSRTSKGHALASEQRARYHSPLDY